MSATDRVLGWTCPNPDCAKPFDEYLAAWPHACVDCGAKGCYFCLTSCPGGDHWVCVEHQQTHDINDLFEGLEESGRSLLAERLQDENPSDLLDRCLKEAARRYCPDGYPMCIRIQKQWDLLVRCVAMGIDSHLEGFTRSSFDEIGGKVRIHPDELHVLLRRMAEITDATPHDGKACRDDEMNCAGEGSCTVGTWEDLRRGIIGTLGPKEDD